MIKNFIIGCGCMLGVISAMALGWGAGEIASKIILRQHTPVAPPVYYCIKGKLYERISDTYVSIGADRTCIPIDQV